MKRQYCVLSTTVVVVGLINLPHSASNHLQVTLNTYKLFSQRVKANEFKQLIHNNG